MNEELYELLENEFLEYRIDEEVEDVLLTLSEALADNGTVGEEISYSERVGDAKLTVYGTCEEDEDGEISVFVRSMKINDREYEINDYLL